MIGVLALQGGFIEHIHALNKLGADAFEIRQKADLSGKQIDGLILPGGESTVISKLLVEGGLFDPIKELINGGTPTFGTCAGLILLSKTIENDDQTKTFGAIDISVERNAFGRQLGSSQTNQNFCGIGKVPMTFIRAPSILRAAEEVQILAKVKGHMVAARQAKVLVTCFHPELTGDLRIHQYFLKEFVV